MATIAAVVGTDLPDDAAEDSFNLLPAWRNNATAPIRPYLLHQAFGGRQTLAIRRGEWKYINHQGSGGNRYENHPGLKQFILPETNSGAPGQLYNLALDPGETRNLYADRPDLVEDLSALLGESISSGRSRPKQIRR
jgi:arylsulfatase A-like enzyme